MKKLLLLFSTILSASLVYGQVVFTVENPPSLQGSYQVTYATPGGGWGTPDMINSDNAITGSLVQAKDATAADSLACETVQNTADFVGGEVQAFDNYNVGSGYTDGNVGVTGGSGTGLTFDILASPIVGVDSLDSASIVGGQDYITSNNVATTTDGIGTGLTVDIIASGLYLFDNSTLVGGSGYTTSTGVATLGGSGTGLTVDIEANPIGGVDSLDAGSLVGGSDYVDSLGAPTSTDGAGTGLTVDIYTEAGVVDSVVINEMGSGYLSGDLITILVGNDENSTIEVQANTNGEITSVSVADVGNDLYEVGDLITINAGDVTATIEISDVNGGQVTEVNINNSGTEYVAGDLITIDDGNGAATIEVLTVEGGDITSILLSDMGDGYVTGDTVIISGGDMNAMVHITNATLGKVAILYRGDCEFGTKALNAQNAGAIACVIINNVPGGPVGMAPGADGGNVTIPVLMISLEDGQNVIETLNSESVDVFIGNKTGFYANDIGVKDGGILRAKSLATPSVLAETAADFNFDVGAWVYNFGFNDQKAVIMKATVIKDGVVLYDEATEPPVDLASRDSVFLTLPTFSSPTYDIGEYVLTYEVVSDSIDDYDFDNTVNANFNINDDYMFTYANVNDTSGLPTSSGIGYQSTIESCIVFKDQNASRLIPTGVTFSAFKGPDAQVESFEGEPMLINILQWNDQFTSINDATYDQLEPKYTQEYVYPADLGSVPVTAKIEPFALEDGKRYLFCVSSYNENIFVMYDGRIDYTENVNTYLEPFTTVRDDQGYYAAGFGTDATPAIGINMVDAAFLDIKKEETSYDMNVYPSPASSKITVDFNGHDVSNVEVLNLAGQSIRSKSVKNGQMNLEFDVNGLENGLYIVRVSLSDGMVSTMNVVVNH